MRRYVVYRMDVATGKKTAIGCIVDRRRTDRGMRRNVLSLREEARELFGEGQGEVIDVLLEPSGPGAGSEETTGAREIATIGAGD